MPEIGNAVSYRCLTGHGIPATELDALTEIWTLDRGARVRVCREHGAPIAVLHPGDGTAASSQLPATDSSS